MEEPIRFDVWGIVERKWLKLAITEIEKMNPELGKLEIHQLVNKSVVRGESIKLVGCLIWEEAQQFMKSCSWAKGMTLYQELYEPYQSSLFCARHNFHYGGCLGCQVCNGFYVR